ncbi:hypothetical protein [Guyparkeria sp.]|uniref:hypothetical protein n=1 Tax=Guyparkeria sp. TaxID=2035736 RepID=UPI003970CC4B
MKVIKGIASGYLDTAYFFLTFRAAFPGKVQSTSVFIQRRAGLLVVVEGRAYCQVEHDEKDGFDL